MADDSSFKPLREYLSMVPSIAGSIGSGFLDDGGWWMKFAIDIDHKQAWRVVQELGHVLNYMSVQDRLPTVFKPVSPPPYLNGGPRDFLSWVVECEDRNFTPGACAEWLAGRLPRPVEDEGQWNIDEEA